MGCRRAANTQTAPQRASQRFRNTRTCPQRLHRTRERALGLARQSCLTAILPRARALSDWRTDGPSQPLPHTPLTLTERAPRFSGASGVWVFRFFLFQLLLPPHFRCTPWPCRAVQCVAPSVCRGESIPKRHPSTSKGAVWMDSAAAPVPRSGRHPPSPKHTLTTSHLHTLTPSTPSTPSPWKWIERGGFPLNGLAPLAY